MGKPASTGIRRIIRAAGYSWAGFRSAFIHEAAFRQELALSLVLLPLALWLGDSGIERALLAGSWLMVLVVELLNSALEAVVDRAGTEHHPLSGRAKDMGSAAVLLAIIIAVLVWVLILL